MSPSEKVWAPRTDLDAEECVLGLALTWPALLPEFVGELSAADFYGPSHAALFAAIVELYQDGRAVDTTSVADVLRRGGSLEVVGGRAKLVALIASSPSPSMARTHAGIVRREAMARRLDKAAMDTRAALADGADPVVVADEVEERIRRLDRGAHLPERYWRSVDDYLAADHSTVGVPLIEGLSYQHTRTLVIAAEKLGKSLIMRQIAFCAAAGVHPFTFKPIEPVRVLLWDAENDDDELVPTMRTLLKLIEAVTGPTTLRPAILSAPYGVDLRSRRDRAEIEEVLEDFRPQLIIGGPLYKLMEQPDNVTDPRHAERLQRVLDDIRKRWGCAVLLEHHAPSGRQGQAREIRSVGGQRWAAWPEVTVALHEKKQANGPSSVEVRFPHPPRGHFRWPKRFDRGIKPGDWPWYPVGRATAQVVEVAPAEEEF